MAADQQNGAPELPGLYFDPRVNKYFAVAPNDPSSNPYSGQNIKTRQAEDKAVELALRRDRGPASRAICRPVDLAHDFSGRLVLRDAGMLPRGRAVHTRTLAEQLEYAGSVVFDGGLSCFAIYVRDERSTGQAYIYAGMSAQSAGSLITGPLARCLTDTSASGRPSGH